MRAVAHSIGRFLFQCLGGEKDNAVHERVARLETDLVELTKSTHAVRLRVSASEAMTIALAWTHPDVPQLVECLNRWMELPDVRLSNYIEALKQQEHARVLSHWTGLLEGTPTPLSHPSARRTLQ